MRRAGAIVLLLYGLGVLVAARLVRPESIGSGVVDVPIAGAVGALVCWMEHLRRRSHDDHDVS